MRIDLYTKVILTVIAVALSALAVQPYTLPKAVNAKEVVDVRIRSIDRGPIWDPISVVCENCR